MLRLVVVTSAVLWMQFPFVGSASASGGTTAASASGPATSDGGGHRLALCCAWGWKFRHGELTWNVSSPDGPSTDVIREAVREWGVALPGLTLTEMPTGRHVDISIAYTPGGGRTEGQAVTTFTRRGLIGIVQITITGAPAPGNSGGLGQIAKHEFGHALGLGHANFPGNLMSPAVSPEPAPIPACDARGVVEANRWKLGEPPERRPEPPPVRSVPC